MTFTAVQQVLHQHPELVRNPANASIVCVSTANPKFLVFDDTLPEPICVVEFGTESLRNIYLKHKQLFAQFPEHVVPPRLCETIPDGRWCVVVDGVAGWPWFTLRQKIVDGPKWHALIDRCTHVLLGFQHAVSRLPNWQSQLPLGDELRRLYHRLEGLGVEHVLLEQTVQRMSGQLDELGPIAGQFQHGDFCLNNLIWTPDNLTLLDFEHLGRTSMPLQDEFMLTDSLLSFTPAPMKITFGQVFRKVIAANPTPHGFAIHHVQALYLYHLLWVLRDFHGNPKRQTRYSDLRIRLFEFLDNPDYFFPMN